MKYGLIFIFLMFISGYNNFCVGRDAINRVSTANRVSANRVSAHISANKPVKLTDLVNPLMGTDSEFELSNGNTYPAIARPWGMNFRTPQTGEMGNGWGYTYETYKIRGIKQTHQHSPWINDYAAFSLLPETDSIVIDEDKRAFWFLHKSETAKPYYYSVYLADYDVTAEAQWDFIPSHPVPTSIFSVRHCSIKLHCNSKTEMNL